MLPLLKFQENEDIIGVIISSLQEKHAERPTAKLDTYFTDRKTHLYTLGKLTYMFRIVVFFRKSTVMFMHPSLSCNFF